MTIERLIHNITFLGTIILAILATGEEYEQLTDTSFGISVS